MKVGSRGFTIVEILVVVAVIAILVVIGVVSYNGVVTRSYIAKASSAVDAYIKILETYRLEKGKYPTYTSATNNICLALDNTLPAVAPFAANQCNTDPLDEAYLNSDFNQLLTPYAGKLPDTVLPTVQYKPGVYTRGLLYYATSDGKFAEVYYSLTGDYPCPRGSRFTESGTFSCVLYLGV